MIVFQIFLGLLSLAGIIIFFRGTFNLVSGTGANVGRNFPFYCCCILAGQHCYGKLNLHNQPARSFDRAVFYIFPILYS